MALLWARASCSSGKTLKAKLSLWIFNLRRWILDQAVLHLNPSYQMWLLLYILSYRTSVQLDFRQFSVVVVVKFTCNTDVVVASSEYCVYLHHHLDWKKDNIYLRCYRKCHLLYC